MKKVRCIRCSQLKARKNFVRDYTRSKAVFPWCSDCYNRVYEKEIRPPSENQCPICSSPTKANYCSKKCQNRARRLNIFGLSPSLFNQLTYSGKCPICNKNVKKWQIDHNHKTGETMGAVCMMCNLYLLFGVFHDVNIAERLVEYLKNPPVERLTGKKIYVGPPNSSQRCRRKCWTGE